MKLQLTISRRLLVLVVLQMAIILPAGYFAWVSQQEAEQTMAEMETTPTNVLALEQYRNTGSTLSATYAVSGTLLERLAQQEKDGLAMLSGQSRSAFGKTTAAAKGQTATTHEIAQTVGAAAAASSEVSRNVQQAAHSASSVAQNVREAVHGVTDIAKNINELAFGAGDVARNAAEAASGMNGIAENVSAMNQSAQDTARGAGDTKGAAGELAELAGKLQQLVGSFKVE